MLTRRLALGLTAGAVLAPRAMAQARLSYDLIPQQVGDGVWMIEGATEYFTQENGGAIVNVTLLKGDNGLIVIDSGPSLRYGEALARVARQIDLRGVTAVVNTHHHPDHFFGNQVFADKPIWALGETLSAAETEGPSFSDNMYRLLGDWMRGTEVIAPNRVLEGGLLQIDGRSLEALPLGGHTVADLALVDQASGTLIAGDLAFLDRAPTTPGADLARWQASLDALAQVGAAQVIPGHGAVDRAGRAIAQTREYLVWLDTTLRQAAREGRDMVEIMTDPLPEAYAAMGAQPQEFERSVAHLFPGIERQELPRGN
jgi:quinoprotein relay system zinc metallohydrolase 1